LKRAKLTFCDQLLVAKNSAIMFPTRIFTSFLPGKRKQKVKKQRWRCMGKT